MPDPKYRANIADSMRKLSNFQAIAFALAIALSATVMPFADFILGEFVLNHVKGVQHLSKILFPFRELLTEYLSSNNERFILIATSQFLIYSVALLIAAFKYKFAITLAVISAIHLTFTMLSLFLITPKY